MTSQEKIQFLKRYKSIDRRIDLKCEELSRWRARATKITPVYSEMPKGGQSCDKVQTTVEKIVEIETDIDFEIDELMAVKKEVMAAINSVRDPVLCHLLELRYIRDKKWEQIAVEMNYDYRWVLKLHGKALNLVNAPLKDTLSCGKIVL